MSVILKSLQIAHVVGVLVIASVFLYNLSVKSVGVQAAAKQEDQVVGALTIVADSSEGDDSDDGVITVEGNGSEDETNQIEEEFIPSDEWKAVKKGQKIPAGLHVRMNMQTGETEAKLVESEDDKNIEQWDAGGNIGVINTEKKRYTRDELKAALKEFKYQQKSTTDEAHEDEVKTKFRSYAELKKAVQELNMSVKTEGEIVTELTQELLQKEIEQERLKTVLLDLEYYLHQIDSARIFSDLGGLRRLLDLLNRTEEDIREAAAFTLGAALQSNSKVQVAAVDSGILQKLLKILSVDPSFLVKKKAVFCLSTLLRQFPYAQKKFVQLGGLSALSGLFAHCQDENLQVKIITLLTDLMVEHDHNVNQVNPKDDTVQEKKTQQYQEVGLVDSLRKSGWCGLLTSLIQTPSSHDSVEKVVTAMLTFVNICRDTFVPAKPKLQALLSEYQSLADQELLEESSDFFSSIHSSLQSLVREIHRTEL